MIPHRPFGPSDNADRDVRHLVEQDTLRMQADLAAAKARTAGEWFDIFREIVATGVRQTLELSAKGKDITDEATSIEFNRLMNEQRPFMQKVRNTLETHGLPLTEEIEFEGPDVKHDAAGAPHIVSWPRGAWIVIKWPDSKSEDLRFEGQSALVALAFLLWWMGFQGAAMHMDGKERTQKSRIVEPGSPEYINYVTGKAKARAT